MLANSHFFVVLSRQDISSKLTQMCLHVTAVEAFVPTPPSLDEQQAAAVRLFQSSGFQLEDHHQTQASGPESASSYVHMTLSSTAETSYQMAE